MAAKIVTVSPKPDYLIWYPENINRLWFFPNGSEYLRYSPHFHAIYHGGFRQNLPLVYMFVVVLEGKLSVKDYWGETTHRIEVSDHTWYFRDTNCQHRAEWTYAQMLPGKAAYARSGRG